MSLEAVRRAGPLGVVDDIWETDNSRAPPLATGRQIDVVPETVRRMFEGRRMLDRQSLSPAQVLLNGDGPDASLPDIGTALKYRTAHRALRASMARDPIGRVHADELEKAVPEYGWYGGWDIPPVPLVTREQDVERIPAEVWHFIRRAFSSSELSRKVPLSVKIGTNHGAPTWRSTIEDHIAHLAWASRIEGVADLERTFAKAFGILEVDFPPAPVLTMLTRTGPLRKTVRVFEWDRGVAASNVSARGYFCRRRQVRAVPTLYNEVLRPTVDALTRAIKAGPLRTVFAHKGMGPNNKSIYRSFDDITARAGPSAMWSDDASNFDDSVNILHLRDLYSLCYPIPARTKELFLAMTVAPLLSGPLEFRSAATLYPRVGTVPSGTISTSLDDAMINFASVIVCVAAGCGWTVASAIDRVQKYWTCRVQGDDTFLIVPAAFDPQKYTAKAAALGFVRAPSLAPIFLKTAHSVRGRPYNLASRALLRSAWRERPTNGPYHETLAAAIRWELARDDPLFDLFFQAFVALNPLAERFRISNYAGLVALIASNAFEVGLELERRRPQGVSNWVAQMEGLGFILAGRDPTDSSSSSDGLASGPISAIAFDRLGGLRATLEARRDLASLNDSTFDPWAYLRSLAASERPPHR